MGPYTLSTWLHPFVNRTWFERDGAVNRVGFAEERVEMDLHVGTHIDALGHTSKGDLMYGGMEVMDVAGDRGLSRLGIDKIPPVITRGVLVDVPHALGQELTAGEVITSAMLEQTLAQEGVTLRRGDLVLIRTGWGRYYETNNPHYVESAPGIGVDAAAWLGERDVVAIGADTMALEVLPHEEPDRPYAVHQLLLVELGIYIIENLALDEIGAAAIYEFACLCLPPKFRGATGAPVRVVAVV
jgi:kynurenine formamidase